MERQTVLFGHQTYHIWCLIDKVSPDLSQLSLTLAQLKVAARMTMEEFFANIHEDLLKYASSFRLCGFYSSVSLRLACRQNFAQQVPNVARSGANGGMFGTQT